MGRMKKFHSTLLAIGGLLIGSVALFLVVLTISGSVRTATIFSGIPFGYSIPLALVFAIASVRSIQPDDLEKEEPSQRDVAISVGYIASSLPYWFSAISAVNGRIGLSFVLFLVYVAMAALPLRSMYRARRVMEMQNRRLAGTEP